MKRDLILSVILHVTVFVAVIAITPFQPKINTDIGEIISVRLASLPYQENKELAPAQPTVMPKAVVEEPELAMVPDTKPSAKEKKVKAKETKKKPADKPKPYQPKTEKGDSAKTGTADGKDVSENLGPGSRFGSALVDNASFDYPYWFVQAFSKIEYNWSNPIFSGQPMECIIYFQVIRSGRVLKAEIEKSSGIDAFDGACLRAINLSKPLPPLPADFVEEIIGIHLTFPYIPK